MSEYDCVGVTSEYLESLKNKIEELEQDIEEYERRLSVSNETIDIYEKLVKHVETQRDDLYQELQSNEMLIEELKNQKAELIQAIESALNKSTRGGWLHRIFENIIEKYSIKI